MYSGGDSSGDGVNSRNQFNWQITSQTSCNINSGGSIDWASLAQQWIQMKDSGTGLPEAPPPPSLGTYSKPNKNIKFDEQGEADMEVEREDEMQIVGFAQNTPPPSINSINTNVWFPLQQDAASYVAPQQNQWTSWPPRVALPPPTLHVPITNSQTPPIGKEIIKSTSFQNNVKTSMEVATFLPNKDSLEPPPMDAAKRKILPAWIREGLEKMEREKLRQVEREQKDKHETVVGAGISAADNDINTKIKTMVKSSIMDMEGESSGNEANETAEADDDNEDIDGEAVLTSSSHVPLLEKFQQEFFNSGKTYEERISDMMIAVRKTLTELLLEVTNEEISSIAHEAIRKRRAKASSAQVIRKSAIPSITGKLGLEAYADSDSENNASDTEATNDDSKRSDDDYDSEEELKANIRICKRAFAKTIDEIEERIQTSTTREEALRREHQKRDRQDRESSDSNKNSSSGKTKGFDPEIGEPQPDKKSNSNGKRKKERTSRFTDNKDSKHRITPTYYQPPSMGSGNLPSPALLGTNTLMPSSNFLPSKYNNSSNNTANSISMVPPSLKEKRSSNNGSTSKSSKLGKTPPPPPPPAITSSSSSSSTAKNHHHSESSSSSGSDFSSSDTHSSQSRRSKASSSHKKRSSAERSKRSKRSYRSSSYRSSHRRDSSDSHDDDHYKKRSSRRHAQKSSHSSSHSRRHGHRRSDTGSSRSRTRSRSRSRSTYSSSRRGDRY